MVLIVEWAAGGGTWAVVNLEARGRKRKHKASNDRENRGNAGIIGL
jgi:hypothetical protein